MARAFADQGGDSCLIRGNMLHSLEALEKSVAIDMFFHMRGLIKTPCFEPQ
jgi:hypothetical protein